jgi:hypothetical protein
MRRFGRLSPGLGPFRAGWRQEPVGKTGPIGVNGRLSRTQAVRGGQTEIGRGCAKKAFEVKALVSA